MYFMTQCQITTLIVRIGEMHWLKTGTTPTMTSRMKKKCAMKRLFIYNSWNTVFGPAIQWGPKLFPKVWIVYHNII